MSTQTEFTSAPVSTSTVNSASPELLRSEIDSRIVKIRPMATPIDQISRHASPRHAGSMTVEYYAVDTKPSSTTITKPTNASTAPSSSSTLTVNYQLASGKHFSASETILITSGEGKDRVSATGYISDVNGDKITVIVTSTNESGLYYAPAFPSGAMVVRMGRAARELDVQTPQFQAIPTKRHNHCQIFKAQVEQSTIVKLANKEVGWSFSDQEEAAIIDMRQGMERNFLFGDCVRLVPDDGEDEIMLTGGIWQQAGQEAVYTTGELTNEAMISICRKAFTGATGSSRKLLIAGTGFIEQLHRLDATRVLSAGDKMTRWGLDFTEYNSKFGTLYILMSETFDQCGHPDDAIIIDPEYLTKYTHIPFSTEKLDLRASGQRNTDAIVITEASCLVLRYPASHMRIIAQ